MIDPIASPNSPMPTESVLRKIYSESSPYWKTMRRMNGLRTFRSCAQKVPAYGDFLRSARIDPASVRTIDDLRKVPSVDKNNYLRAHPLERLCANGSLSSGSVVFTSTSGSTGDSFYFPRDKAIDLRSSVYHEMFLKNSRTPENGSTLVVVCFGMGVWIGGIITYQAFKMISERSYRLAIITPGVNKGEIFAALKCVAPKYDQVILCGYPPFMKDVVDEASARGIDWKKINVKMIFAAETVSETFRDHIAERVGVKDVYRDTMNIYGSADLGTMAEETPLCILIRRLALANEALYKKLFKEASRLPTLAQFHPGFINFDCVDGRVFCTSDSVMPLVRYEIGDNGGVMDFDEVEKIFAEEGLNLIDEVKKVGLADSLSELPFIYIYERTDLSAKFYGAIVYPEHVRGGLLDAGLQDHITGKFTMSVKHDDNMDEYLEINVELKPGANGSDELAHDVSKRVFDSLTAKSAEYKNNADMFSAKVQPKIIFWPHEHPTHFRSGAKQKWVKN
jgi:phenylacetate-CoA ligase